MTRSGRVSRRPRHVVEDEDAALLSSSDDEGDDGEAAAAASDGGRLKLPRSKTAPVMRRNLAIVATAAIQRAAVGPAGEAAAGDGNMQAGGRRGWAQPGLPVNMDEQVCARFSGANCLPWAWALLTQQ